MASKEDENYFEFLYKCYDWTGLRKSSKLILKIVSLYILYPITVILFAMIIYDIRYKHNNIFDIAEIFMSFLLLGYIIIRKVMILKYGFLYEDIFQSQNRYWNYNLFGKTTESELRQMMRFRLSLIKFIGVNSAVTIFLRCVTPFVLDSKTLPLECWIPGNNTVVKNIIYVLESLVYIDCLLPLLVYDGLYLLMTSNLKSQFILLKKAVESIQVKYGEDKKTLIKLKSYCQYHSFLLRIHKKINKIYSAYFLATYVLAIGGTCIPLFMINDGTSSMTQIIESTFIAFLVNMLLMMGFIPASEVEIEAENLALQIYSINWYDTKNIEIRKFILFWLMQAQVPVQMTGGGMLIINRTVMLQIQRIGYSLSTLLTNLK